MKRDDTDVLTIFREATEASPEVVERIRHEVLRRSATPASQKMLLRTVPPAGPRSIERIREQVLSHPPPADRVRPRAAWAAIPALALAAMAAIAIGLSWTKTEPQQATVVDMASGEGWTEQRLYDGVYARYSGDGSRSIERADIAWNAGLLELTVDPTAGQRVNIQTPEANILVVGTILSVQRSALGTRVDVSKGLVHVDCTGMETQLAAAGASVICMPTTPAGMLGRARALDEQGAFDDVLATVDAGLELATGPIEAELSSLRITTLIRLGDKAGALDALESYLRSNESLRRVEMASLGAELALQDKDCDRATPFLAALTIDQPSAGSFAMLAQCEEGDRRRLLLEEAMTLATTEDDRALIRRMMQH